MLIGVLVCATVPAIPLPNCTLMCVASVWSVSSMCELSVTSNSFETRKRCSPVPRTRNRLPRSPLIYNRHQPASQQTDSMHTTTSCPIASLTTETIGSRYNKPIKSSDLDLRKMRQVPSAETYAGRVERWPWWVSLSLLRHNSSTHTHIHTQRRTPDRCLMRLIATV